MHDLLFSLRRARIPTALITNGGSDTQREKLTVLNLEPWFDVVIVSGEFRLAKPDAAVFALALDRLGIGPEGVWHVGDSLRTDVAGAKAANLTAVWLNRRALPPGPNDPFPTQRFARWRICNRLVPWPDLNQHVPVLLNELTFRALRPVNNGGGCGPRFAH